MTQVISPRPDIDPLPLRMRSLKIDPRTGYPVPYFVAYNNGEAEFRAMDPKKLRRCINENLCWVCGEVLGVYKTFVTGPLAGLNRVHAEPPLHHECALFSVRNCPFLVNPNRKRREDDLINNDKFVEESPGMAITRNPGVTLLWTTKNHTLFNDGRGGILFRIGDPCQVEFYANGRTATAKEIQHSIETGLPTLQNAAEQDGDAALAMLADMRQKFEKLCPQE